MFKISEKSNSRIIEKWLKFLLSHSDYRNSSLTFIAAFFRRFKDLEPMLVFTLNRCNLKFILVPHVKQVLVCVDLLYSSLTPLERI